LNEFIIHRPVTGTYSGQKSNTELSLASGFKRATDECTVPPLDIGIQAITALTLSLRRCRATVYTSSAVPRFTRLSFNRYMLLSPFSFKSRLVVRLGVICPELRPPPVAILSVRDTAHTHRCIRLSNIAYWVLAQSCQILQMSNSRITSTTRSNTPPYVSSIGRLCL
jgi:hypothetical protein